MRTTVRAVILSLSLFTHLFCLAVSSEEVSLEPALVLYITDIEEQLVAEIRSHKSHSKSLENHSCHRLERNADRLSCAVRLLELLIRTVEQPEVILHLSNVMALLDLSAIFWEDDDTKVQEGSAVAGDCNMEVQEGPGLSSNPSSCDETDHRGGNSSPPDNSVNFNNGRDFCPGETSRSNPAKNNPNKSRNIIDSLDIMTTIKIARELNNKAKRNRRRKQTAEYKRIIQSRDRRRTRRKSSLLDSCFNDVTEVKDSEEIVCLAPSTLSELRDLRRCLEQYFAQILQYWFKYGDLSNESSPLCRVLAALEQCHMHQVLPVLEAVKKRDSALVSTMQEALLDHKASPRLVALLAKLYE